MVEVQQDPRPKLPLWTVLYNIVSPEGSEWIGTGWEFFTKESEATIAYERHEMLGNVPTKRPFHPRVDVQHLAAHHRDRLSLV